MSKRPGAAKRTRRADSNYQRFVDLNLSLVLYELQRLRISLDPLSLAELRRAVVLVVAGRDNMLYMSEIGQLAEFAKRLVRVRGAG